jgi:hypothetical protein
MLQELNIKPENYSVLLDALVSITNNNNLNTVKSLYQNLGQGCKCQYASKVQVLVNRFQIYLNEELTDEIKNALKEKLKTSKINIFSYQNPTLLIYSF